MSGSIKINDYDKFRCMADKCSFTCCQEWKIGVDEKTYLKWKGKKLEGQSSSLCHQVTMKDGDGIIKLNREKKCPFLNENKLCNVVIAFGEDHLSQTCTTFPRQINTFAHHKEYSLDACCPVVVDMMRENADCISFNKENIDLSHEPLFEVREMMMAIMEKESYSIPERLMIIFYNLLELLDKKSLTLKVIDACKEDSYLVPIAKAIRNMNFYTMDTIYEGNELFLDVVENYRKQKLYVQYLEDIATFAEDLEENYTEEQIVESFNKFIPLFNEYEKLMKHYMISEIFGSSLLEDMDLEEMIIASEWLSIKYAVVRQAIFLKWMMQESSEKETLDYTIVKDYIMIMSRVMGYDQCDINEYMENSFEEVIWEWGYAALIIGHNKM